ncbi:MAG: hypothetical protein EP329_27045 [Deltaproteobacteria bacterium]|nr:MAG: hypothetical protein EP329_27045 [Deltaproteobacteria bacterium]
MLATAGAVPEALAEVRAASPDIAAALARHAAPAPCHYDLNPGNLLFDGERVWLVDWEMAGAGDPFHDLGTLCVFGVPAGAQQETLLTAYLGRLARPDERARLHLARLQALVFYAAIFHHITRRPGAPPSPPAEPPLRLAGYLATLRAAPDGTPRGPDPHLMRDVLTHEVTAAWRAAETAAALATL